MYRLLLIGLLAAAAVAPAGASTGQSGGDAFSAEKGLDLSRSFEAQHQAILKALADGETYSEIDPNDREVVKTSLGLISGWLGEAQSADQLNEEHRIRVFNEQEKINALLGRAHADSRIVCRREKPTGSNRSTNVCMSVAERRRQRDSARDFLRYNPRGQAKPTTP